MKKIAVLISVAFLAFSCSDDESVVEDSISSTDLAGTWTLTSQQEAGVTVELNSCELESTLTFVEDQVTIVNVSSITSGVTDTIDELVGDTGGGIIDGLVGGLVDEVIGDNEIVDGLLDDVDCEAADPIDAVFSVEDNQLSTNGVIDNIEGEVSISGSILTLTVDGDVITYTKS